MPPPPTAEQTKDGKYDATAVSDDDLTDGSAIEKLEKRAVDKADKDVETLGKLDKEGNDAVAALRFRQSKKGTSSTTIRWAHHVRHRN